MNLINMETGEIIDQVSCKECKWVKRTSDSTIVCILRNGLGHTEPDGYCYLGERP